MLHVRKIMLKVIKCLSLINAIEGSDDSNQIIFCKIRVTLYLYLRIMCLDHESSFATLLGKDEIVSIRNKNLFRFLLLK